MSIFVSTVRIDVINGLALKAPMSNGAILTCRSGTIV